MKRHLDQNKKDVRPKKRRMNIDNDPKFQLNLKAYLGTSKDKLKTLT